MERLGLLAVIILFLLSFPLEINAINKSKIGIIASHVEVDNNESVYVLGNKGKEYGILKFNKKGDFIKIIGEEFNKVSPGGMRISQGGVQFIKDGPWYGPGTYKYIELYTKVAGYQWGSTREVFILADSEKAFLDFFKFLGEKPSVEAVFKKVIRPSSLIAVNSKGQLCMIGSGLRKAHLPLMEKGKAAKRDSGEIIYTDEFYEPRIGILDPIKGHPLVIFGEPGINEGELCMPIDIAVDSGDNIYVVDRFRNKVIKFSPNGEFIKEWGKWGSGDSEFEGLWGIAIDKGSDTIYTTQSGMGSAADPYVVFQVRVQKFDSEGKFLGKWGGSRITGIGWFWLAPAPIRKYDLDDPRSIAVGPDSSVWLIEVHKPCISKFTPDGKLLLRFGEKGDINGDPRGEIGWYSEGIAVGPDGTVYVCDNGRTGEYSKKLDQHGKRFREYLTKTGKQDFKEKSPEPEPRIVKFDSEGRYLGEIK